MPLSAAAWHACHEPTDLLKHLEPRASQRKLRLFAVACCQRVWPLLTRSAVHNAVHTAERFADGHASRDDLRAGWLAVRKVLSAAPLTTKWENALMAALHATSETMHYLTAQMVADAAGLALDYDWRSRTAPLNTDEDRLRRRHGMKEEREYQCRLLRDMFSYTPATLDPAWQAWERGQVVTLAQTIYDEERFQDMPVLADALEEAGCADVDVLYHCRHGEVHVRGCWVLDLLTGRGE